MDSWLIEAQFAAVGFEIERPMDKGFVLTYRVSWRRVPLLSSLHGEKESQNSIKSVPFQTHFHLDIEILLCVQVNCLM